MSVPPLATLCVLGAFALVPLRGDEGAKSPPRIPRSTPNVILVVFDDVGYGDFGCYGAKHPVTPHLDALAASGLRATDFYVAQPVCSASRAAILTGCYPNRIGISGALDHRSDHGLAETETTLAEICKQKDYATAAIGKWHVGHHPQFLPLRHGFDEFFGIPYSNDMKPDHAVEPGIYPPLPLIEGERVVETEPDQNEFTRRFTDRALDFIERSKDRPFFLYLAHPMAHVPLHVSKERRGSTGFGLYADVIAELDDSIGALVKKLEDLDLREDTLLFVTSDNGPWLSFGEHAGSAGELREGKGTTFEGGVRVPCIVSWPARIAPGRVFREPWMAIDLLPTIARALETDIPPLPIDGVSLFGALVAKADAPRDPTFDERNLYFWYQDGDLEAMRRGNWKLHFPHLYRSMAGAALGEDGRSGRYVKAATNSALFDLATDPGEKHDLAGRHRDVVRKLDDLARPARRDLGDALRGKFGTGHREPGRLER